MTKEASKSKLAFRKTVASEAIAASEFDTAERILARFVALAYAGDHPEAFTDETKEYPGTTVP